MTRTQEESEIQFCQLLERRVEQGFMTKDRADELYAAHLRNCSVRDEPDQDTLDLPNVGQAPPENFWLTHFCAFALGIFVAVLAFAYLTGGK